MFRYIAIACLLGVAAGAPHWPLAGYAAVEHDAYPRYGFNYAVSDPHTGDHKSQSEHRDGGHVKGSYSVAEHDGTLRVVDYHADPHTGFNAVVKRIGHAHHPHHYVAPIIKAPIVAAPAYATSLVGIGGWGGLGHAGFGLGHGLGLDHGVGLGLGYSGLGLGYHGLGLGHGHGGHGWHH